MYKVILKDDRGTDTSTLNLTDQGNPAESVHHLITAANMSRNMIKSCSLVGFKDLMNEVFSYIGKPAMPDSFLNHHFNSNIFLQRI